MTTLAARIVAVVAALFLPFAGANSHEPHWPETPTIGTASPGGTYYGYGEGLAPASRFMSRPSGSWASCCAAITPRFLVTEGKFVYVALDEERRPRKFAR
jgi:hypothetical protein